MVSLSAMAVLVALSRVEIGAGGADAGRLASRPRNARRWVRLMLPPFHLALDRVARCQGLVHCASRVDFTSAISASARAWRTRSPRLVVQVFPTGGDLVEQESLASTSISASSITVMP